MCGVPAVLGVGEGVDGVDGGLAVDDVRAPLGEGREENVAVVHDEGRGCLGGGERGVGG